MSTSTADPNDLRYLGSLSVLYVEDEDDIRDQLAQFLRRRCRILYTAANGKIGLDAFNRHKPDIVITDILMPVLDGLKMLTAIRELDSSVPFIVTTAFEETGYFQKAIDLGVDKYVVKPVTSSELMEALLKCARAVRSEAALREVEQRYRLLFKLSHIAISVSDAEDLLAELNGSMPLDGRIVDCNDSFLKITGYTSVDELSQCSFLDLCAPDYRQQQIRLIKDELLVRGFTRECELELLRKDGGNIPVVSQLVLRRDETGKMQEVWAVMRDISERRKAEQDLRLAAGVFANSYDAILVTDADNRIVSVNKAFTEITGYSADEAVGRTPSLLQSGRHDRSFYQSLWTQLQESGHWQGEIWNRRKDGEIYPEWLSISVIQNGQGKAANYIGIFTDITRAKEAQDYIQFLAHYDPLTRLPNRLLLQDRLAQAISSAQRADGKVAVMFLDLDRFKNINDSLGHECGDALLVEVATRLKRALREEDTVARLGGDEFVVVLRNVRSADDVGPVAHKILDTLHDPFLLDPHQLTVTSSIGISLYPDDGTDSNILMKNADAAMYAAKQTGRNTCVFFAPSMNAGALERLSMENSLRRALEQEEFRLHYQPRIDIQTGRIVGFEALLRWKHPELGDIPPARFVPLAEETGLIVPIGAWALQTACTINREWQLLGLPPVTVAVNLSSLQFRQKQMQEAVLNALKNSGLNGSYLELELTESVVMENPEAATESLRLLKKLGVQLSIDDFGTGYSSLAYLKRFPLDTLKIDQSFVRDLVVDADDASIVSAVISMAHDLGLDVVAEGVETLEQLRFLRARQCDGAQGYLFGRAVDAETALNLLRQRAIQLD
jgi:diguanylate cyclase (GGDEF)-like protein/PAS domain S-box-containing protein